MINNCSECIGRSPMVTELMHMLMDGDPIRLMEILADLATQPFALQILDEADYRQIRNLNHLLGEMARAQRSPR